MFRKLIDVDFHFIHHIILYILEIYAAIQLGPIIVHNRSITFNILDDNDYHCQLNCIKRDMYMT